MEDNDSDKLALVPTKRRELAQTLVDAINAKHAEGLACDDELRQVVERKLRICGEAAVLLAEARETFRHQFDELIARHLGFGPRALRSYTVIAAKVTRGLTRDFKSKWRSIEDAAKTTELIPPSDGHGVQKLHSPNFFTVATRQLISLIAGFRKYVRTNPLETWSEDKLDQFAMQLRPIVDAYAQIQKRLSILRK